MTATAGDASDEFDLVWSALASRTRRRILDLLAADAMTTGDLAEVFDDLSRFAVMQHLKVLEAADLVVARRSGRHRYNHINPVPIQQLSDRWISRFHRPFAEALVDLKLTMESQESAGESRRADQSDPTQEGVSA